ncbi:MAG: VTT domain-containing protein [Nanoarchaeota archaeon]|nr:VTT domain-containing protein [Nanoarchaeota archaeon]
MFSGFTSWLLAAITTHKMLAVVLGVAIETIIVPIPSPIILMFAGYVLIDAPTFFGAFFQALWISLVAGLTQTIGSYFVFGIAYYGGKPLIDRFEKLHGVSWKEILDFRKKFEKKKRQEVTLAVLRALPIMPLSVISGVAGVIKMDFRKYTLATFIGTIPRNMILALLGWTLKDAYEALAMTIDHMETIVSIILVILILVYIVAHKYGIITKIRKHII